MKRRAFFKKAAASAFGFYAFPRLVLSGNETSQNGAAVVEIKTQFMNPKAICLDGAGNIYSGCCGWVSGLEKFQKSDAGNAYVKAWAVDKIKIRGIALESSGNICVTNEVDSTQGIKVFAHDGKLLESWGSNGIENGQFCGPTGIVANGKNEIYVVESSKWGANGGPGQRVQKFGPDGKFLLKWGSEGGNPGQFNLPTGMALDRQQNVYVADSYNCRIQKFSPDGKFLAAWGGYGSGDGQFNCPQGIAIDRADNILVADTYNNRILQFTANGDFVAKWGRQGSGKGEFWLPCGIAVDNDGTVYVADTMNNRLQVFKHLVKGAQKT